MKSARVRHHVDFVEDRGGAREELLSLTTHFGLMPSSSRVRERASADLSRYLRVKPGDVVVNRLIAQFGAIAFARTEGIVSPAYWVLRPKAQEVDSAFLGYFMRSQPFLDEVARLSKYAPPAQYDIRWDRFRGIPVLVPHFEEQSLIGRYLDHAELRIAQALAAQSALLSRLTEAKLAVVSELVLGDSHNRTTTGVPGLESVPRHWRWIRAKYVWRSVDVRSVRGSEERLSVSSARGVVLRSSANVTMFQAASYVGHKVVQPGNLVINTLWAWGRGLGVSRHFGLVSPVYGVYELVDKESDVAYLDHLLRSNAYQWQFQVRSKGIWKSRLSLSDDAFLDMPMLLPPLEEQRSIAARISEQTAAIDAAIAAVEREIALLKEYRVKLISDVVTGKLDVTTEAEGLPDIDPVELAQQLAGLTGGVGDDVEDEEGGGDGDD